MTPVTTTTTTTTLRNVKSSKYKTKEIDKVSSKMEATHCRQVRRRMETKRRRQRKQHQKKHNDGDQTKAKNDDDDSDDDGDDDHTVLSSFQCRNPVLKCHTCRWVAERMLIAGRSKLIPEIFRSQSNSERVFVISVTATTGNNHELRSAYADKTESHLRLHMQETFHVERS